MSGENGTRFTHSSTVSQTLASEPPTVSAMRTARATNATPARGVRSGKSPISNVAGRAYAGLARPSATARSAVRIGGLGQPR